MNSLGLKFHHHANNVRFTESVLQFVLAGGREISALLECFPRLRDATINERNVYRFIRNGLGVHCLAIDEDVSVSTLMSGVD